MEKDYEASSPDVKLDYKMGPQEILEVQDGVSLAVSPAESRAVLRKIDLWSVKQNAWEESTS
jgi:hypothetical protein